MVRFLWTHGFHKPFFQDVAVKAAYVRLCDQPSSPCFVAEVDLTCNACVGGTLQTTLFGPSVADDAPSTWDRLDQSGLRSTSDWAAAAGPALGIPKPVRDKGRLPPWFGRPIDAHHGYYLFGFFISGPTFSRLRGWTLHLMMVLWVVSERLLVAQVTSRNSLYHSLICCVCSPGRSHGLVEQHLWRRCVG